MDLDADPSFADVVARRAQRTARFRDYLDQLEPDALAREVDVLENGPNPVEECVLVVLEEEFEHLRYATRDLDRL